MSKCYIDIISSQLSREQIEQYCEYLRPTKSLRRLATLCRAALQLRTAKLIAVVTAKAVPRSTQTRMMGQSWACADLFTKSGGEREKFVERWIGYPGCDSDQHGGGDGSSCTDGQRLVAEADNAGALREREQAVDEAERSTRRSTERTARPSASSDQHLDAIVATGIVFTEASRARTRLAQSRNNLLTPHT